MHIVSTIVKTLGFHLKYAAAAAAIIILLYGIPAQGYVADHNQQAPPLVSAGFNYHSFSDFLYDSDFFYNKTSKSPHFQQWQNLSPSEQDKMRKRYQEWQSLPPEKQKLYKQLYRQWKHLPPEERRQLQKDLDNWDNLSPQRQNEIRRRFKN